MEDDMKTALAILVAGFVLMGTPILASAHGNHYRSQRDSYRSWVNHSDSYSVHVRHKEYQNRCNKRHLRHEKRQLRRELRQTRQELRRVKRRVRHQRQRPYYAVQPYYVNPPVVFGIPQLVFQFGW